jgi:3-oxoacyl-[acyl-carrier-protein] synthase II
VAADRLEIAISGVGAVTGYGPGVQALWAGIERGADCLRPIHRFSTAELASPLAGALPPWPGELPDGDEERFRDLCVRAAVSAAREAWEDARAAGAGVPAHRVALVVGTSTQADDRGLEDQTRRMARELGVAGPCIGIGTVCCSSTGAVGLGRDLLENGCADLVLAGGAEALTPELAAGFSALKLLSRERCAPFSEPAGTTLAEGAGFVVLEPWERAVRRGLRPHAALAGYGLSCDAYHETGPDPSGAGVARAVRMALADAGLTGREVGYVNAHGTGTQANDPAEWRALRAALGSRAAEIPVSSSKGHLGHAQSAAGALELIITLLAMGRQVVPPTLHFRRPRAGAPADPVGQDVPRPATFDVALSTNSAMAGANAAVVVARGPGRRPRPARRSVHAAGCATIGLRTGGLGRGLEAMLEQIAPSVDPRGMDPSGVMVTATAAQAVKAAGVKLAGPLRERAGIFLGNSRLSPATIAEFRASIAERGLARLSTAAFARRMLSAPAGTCAMALSLKGPTTTLATGAGEGLVAIACAADLLERREDVELLLAGGVVEHRAGSSEDRAGGAAFLALRGGGEGDVRLAGWGLAGPDRSAEAVEQALARAGLRRQDVEVRFREWPRSPGFDAVLAFEAVQRGEARVAMAIADEGCGGAATCALLFARAAALR